MLNYMADLYFLRQVELHPDDAAKIAPFIHAYRPHKHPNYIVIQPDPYVSALDFREILAEGRDIDDCDS